MAPYNCQLAYPPNSTDLVRIKTELEFGEFPVPGVMNAHGGPLGRPPRLLIARTESGYLRYIRESLPDWLVEELLRLDPEQAYHDSLLVQRALNRHTPVAEVGGVRWYTFDQIPATSTPDVSNQNGAFVVTLDGRVVSRARTELMNDLAAEVGVETDPAYRRRGFARQVVSTWVAGTIGLDLVPLYSHRIYNIASEQLALSLGAILFSEEVEYE